MCVRTRACVCVHAWVGGCACSCLPINASIESGVVPVSIFSSIINGLGEEACPGPQAEDVIEAFRQFDRESNGFITASEVRHLLSGLEEELEDTKSKTGS